MAVNKAPVTCTVTCEVFNVWLLHSTHDVISIKTVAWDLPYHQSIGVKTHHENNSQQRTT